MLLKPFRSRYLWEEFEWCGLRHSEDVVRSSTSGTLLSIERENGIELVVGSEHESVTANKNRRAAAAAATQGTGSAALRFVSSKAAALLAKLSEHKN